MKLNEINTDLMIHMGKAEGFEEITKAFGMTLLWSSELLRDSRKKLMSAVDISGCNSETLKIIGVVKKVPRHLKKASKMINKRAFTEEVLLYCLKNNQMRQRNEESEDYTPEALEDLVDLTNMLDIISQSLRQELIRNDLTGNTAFVDDLLKEVRTFIDHCCKEANTIKKYFILLDHLRNGNDVMEQHLEKAILSDFKELRQLRFD